MRGLVDWLNPVYMTACAPGARCFAASRAGGYFWAILPHGVNGGGCPAGEPLVMGFPLWAIYARPGRLAELCVCDSMCSRARRFAASRAGGWGLFFCHLPHWDGAGAFVPALSGRGALAGGPAGGHSAHWHSAGCARRRRICRFCADPRGSMDGRAQTRAAVRLGRARRRPP